MHRNPQVLPAIASKKIGAGGYIVLRPDSGDPTEAVLMVRGGELTQAVLMVGVARAKRAPEIQGCVTQVYCSHHPPLFLPSPA